MHGEYKTQRGKLVVADFAVRAGLLVDVRISGDFFLYPEEAIHRIDAALNGAPVSASIAEFAQRICQSLPADAEMLGFSPEAVAEAVVRGLA